MIAKPMAELVDPTDLDPLLDRLTRLARARGRALVGLAGAPGAGKSTIAERLAAELGGSAVVVPFDGFHLSNEVLRSLHRQDRKGAIDTFDLAGYSALIERISAATEQTIYAPAYRREIEEAVAGAIAIGPEVTIVLTEGNYLLAGQSDLVRARALLDEVWYVDVDPATRLSRLIGRHVRFGKDLVAAREWASGPDQANAELVAGTRAMADLVITFRQGSPPSGHR